MNEFKAGQPVWVAIVLDGHVLDWFPDRVVCVSQDGIIVTESTDIESVRHLRPRDESLHGADKPKE